MSRYITNPLTRLIVKVTGLAEEKSAQWARGLVVLAFALVVTVALMAT